MDSKCKKFATHFFIILSIQEEPSAKLNHFKTRVHKNTVQFKKTVPNLSYIIISEYSPEKHKYNFNGIVFIKCQNI